MSKEIMDNFFYRLDPGTLRNLLQLQKHLVAEFSLGQEFVGIIR